MMKTTKLFNIAVIASALFIAMPVNVSAKAARKTKTKTETTVKEKETAKPAETVKPAEPVKPAETVNPALKKELENLVISKVSVPAVPMAGSAFDKPFVVSVKDKEGNPLCDYKLSVTAPTGKDENGVVFTKAEITTDASGNASYKPSAIATSMNSVITFAPAVSSENKIVEELVNAVSIQVPCKVQFVLPRGKHIMVAVVDYDQNGKMVLDSALSSSSHLIKEIWNSGYPYQAQNADFHNQIDQGSAAIYARAKDMVQGATYYRNIVYGKVTYVSDITEVEGASPDHKYSLTLTCTVTAIDWVTGKDVCKITKTTTVTSKNKWEILKACQVQLAKEVAADLICEL